MSDIADTKDVQDAFLPAQVKALARLHDRIFRSLENGLSGWFNGFAARFAFASLLLLYYLNSGWNKLGDGVFGFLKPSVGAYASILPPVFEDHGADVDAIPFYWDFVVILGTMAEIALPLLIVLGLFSRIAALGMIAFIAVQSYVDIAFHGLSGKYVGAMFDRFPDSIIFDQRMMWVFLMLMIVANGPGRLSLDHLLARRFRQP
ncbi:DoxX family protein [Oricola thermophila]|uniref:DoxX family protein n=1 Tax=Oricola thermophila TaxID=2742145 RepID=A0A6N1VHH3_9HYPH|nr:DoxX family protein [Oricola thermophila]QKV20361.1 DoxX family protein [Oricola thermophila]